MIFSVVLVTVKGRSNVCEESWRTHTWEPGLKGYVFAGRKMDVMAHRIIFSPTIGYIFTCVVFNSLKRIHCLTDWELGQGNIGII